MERAAKHETPSNSLKSRKQTASSLVGFVTFKCTATKSIYSVIYSCCYWYENTFHVSSVMLGDQQSKWLVYTVKTS